jgi:hypothetical protein
VADPDGERGDLHAAQAGLGEETGQMAFADTSQARLVVGGRIQLADRGPEHGQRAPAARVIPHAGGDSPARPGDPGHLPQAQHGISHEMHDQLRQGGVEGVIGERQLLGRALPDVGRGHPRPCRRGERR